MNADKAVNIYVSSYVNAWIFIGLFFVGFWLYDSIIGIEDKPSTIDEIVRKNDSIQKHEDYLKYGI